jgi:hypothetical protein
VRRTVMLLVVLTAASLFNVLPSRAQFLECSADYIGEDFRIPAEASDPGWSPGQIHCHEFFRYSFSTPAGTRWIRLIGDEHAGRAMPPGAIAAIEEGAHRSTRLMSQLGAYLVDDITMLVGQPRSSSAEAQPERGYDDAWTVSGDGPEFRACNITLFITLNHDTGDIHQTVGHEIFHCIQTASLPEAVTATQTAEGMWWSEGSAETFGVAAARSAGGRYNRAADFEVAVENRTPLYRMSYDAVIFFFYLVQEDGMDGLLPFLRGMADTAGEPAQLEAMRGVKSAEFWNDFAQAYDDRTIHAPGGLPLAFGQRIDGDTWAIAGGTSRHERELWPFIIELGWGEYECGGWSNALSRSFEVRRIDGSDWAPWPETISADDHGDRRYRLATMITDATAITYTLAAEKRESCTECQVSRAIDACVVGRWRQTGGGPLEYLRSRGIPITVANQTELVLTMNADGTFSTNEINTDVEIEMPTPRGTLRSTGAGRTSAVIGRWAALDGELQGCIDSGGEREGVTTFPESPEADRVSRELGRGPYINTHPWGGSAAGTSGGAAYECSDTTLTTSSPTEHGPMEYIFTRESPPPR